MKQRSINRKAIVFVALGLCIVIQVRSPAIAETSEVLLQRGKTVDVEFVTDVRPNTARAGDTVSLKVARDMYVEGTLVLKEGAKVVGEIRHAQRRGPVGRPAKIEVYIKHAFALDGARIPLSGSYTASARDRQVESLGITLFYCLCGIFLSGEDTYVREGTIVTCIVDADVYVSIQE